jgi:hypothetical protein
MLIGLLGRIRYLRIVAATLIGKFLLPPWAVLGALDLTLSQVVPKKYSEKVPKLYEVVEMTTGWLPWHFWAISGAVLVALAALEAGYNSAQECDVLRRQLKDKTTKEELLERINRLYVEAQRLWDAQIDENYTLESWERDIATLFERAENELKGKISEFDMNHLLRGGLGASLHFYHRHNKEQQRLQLFIHRFKERLENLGMRH